MTILKNFSLNMFLFFPFIKHYGGGISVLSHKKSNITVVIKRQYFNPSTLYLKQYKTGKVKKYSINNKFLFTFFQSV